MDLARPVSGSRPGSPYPVVVHPFAYPPARRSEAVDARICRSRSPAST